MRGAEARGGLPGVPHSWIVDPQNETLTVLRHSAEAYFQVLTAGVGDVVHAETFEAEPLHVGELFGVDT